MPKPKPAATPTDLPIQAFATPTAWAAWLAKNHEKAPGLWLQLAKKDSGIASVTYAEALDVALCFGWIDGLKKTFDATSWLQRFTPRRPKSIWSKINTEKVRVLIDAGAMKPAGLAAVEKAKADGRWAAAYGSQKTLTMPEAFAAALEASPAAKAMYATLNSANRYAMLFRLQNAKKAETRAKLVAKFVAMLERGEMLHPKV